MSVGTRAVRGAGGALALAMAVLIAGGDATAQQTVPGPADPGRVEERFERLEEPRSGEPLVVPAPEQPLPPDEADRVRFVLNGLNLEGMTVFTEGQIRPLYADMLGQEVNLREVFDLAGRITAKYRAEGYILSQALVPQQQIEGGVVRIQIIEGFIDGITIDGEFEGSRSMLKAYGEKLKSSRPLHSSDLERYLLLAGDLPGFDVQAVLSPSPDTPGGTHATLLVEKDRFEPFASADNRGTRFLGPYQFEAGVALNSLTGLYERTQLRAIVTQQPNELQYYELRETIPVGTEGTTIQGFGHYTRTRPGFTLKPLNVEGDAWTAGVRIEHPFIRSRAQNLSASATFDIRNSTTDVLGTTITDDRIRSLRLGATYDFVDKWRGISLVSGTVNQGLGVMGARGNSRAGGSINYTSLQANASRLQSITDRWSVLMGVTGQFALDELLSSEEFGYGGRHFGRAFDPSEIVGDHGVAARVELRFGDRVQDQDWAELISDYQFYTFYDWGRVWRIAPTAGRERTATGASVGGGVRWNFSSTVSGSLEVAKPLIRDVGSMGTMGDRVRGFFSIGARF